jgi:hypothetical protein
MWYLLGYLPMKPKKKKESEFMEKSVWKSVGTLVEIDNRRFSRQVSKIIYIYI